MRWFLVLISPRVETPCPLALAHSHWTRGRRWGAGLGSTPHAAALKHLAQNAPFVQPSPKPMSPSDVMMERLGGEGSYMGQEDQGCS